MPNGDPDFYQYKLPLLEAFFAKITPVLESFAETHNLKIEKYYHQGASWSLMFKHPEGGIGQIEVLKIENVVLICESWWIDDYDTSTRFFKYSPGNRTELAHTALRQALETALQRIVQWRKEELMPDKIQPPWSNSCSKENFSKQFESLPELKL
ncbi:MAG: hypothetical protein LLF76_10190 [Planctomycetaceae bacterium]|nr:hypothetical protein [Planctomycetaceae bacterium]